MDHLFTNKVNLRNFQEAVQGYRDGRIESLSNNDDTLKPAMSADNVEVSVTERA
jgi:hypothetical protein